MKYIIFDADFTLLDFEEDERRAIRAAYRAVGREASLVEVEGVRAFSDGDWAKRGLWSVHEQEVQKYYHARYEEHLSAVSDYIHSLTGGDHIAVKNAYEGELFAPALLLPEAEETVKELAKSYSVCVATNGLARMQRGRLSRLSSCLFEIFVSEELKFIKPQEEFFARILQKLNASPSDCIMVGDSLDSDVIGASKAGIRCIWYDRSNAPAPSGVEKVNSLKEILRLV